MIINVHSVYRNLLIVNLCTSCMLLVRGLARSLMEIELICVIHQIQVLCRIIIMNNAMGHIKNYIRLIRCFFCCFKFLRPSCGEVFVFVSSSYLQRQCVVFCCCIKFHRPSCGEVFVIVSSLYLYRHCVVLLLYQILPPFPQ